MAPRRAIKLGTHVATTVFLLAAGRLPSTAQAQLSPLCFMTEGQPSCEDGRFCCAPMAQNNMQGCCDAYPDCNCDSICPNMMAIPTFPGMDLLGTCVEDQYCPTTPGLYTPRTMFSAEYCRCVAHP